MKLARKTERMSRPRATEVLGVPENEASPMADFEQLFTPEERQSLERKFVETVEELGGGKPDKREFIEGELSGLLVLDQVLTVPLVDSEMRRRARKICQVDIQNYVDQLFEALRGEERLNGNLLERLGVTRRVFPELAASAVLSDGLVTIMLSELKYGKRPTEWEEARILFNTLILNLGQQEAIKHVAWAHGSDETWKAGRVAHDRLLPKALHRLLEPGTALTPAAREKWVAHYLEINQSQSLHEIMSLSIRGYGLLAILLAPEPRVMPDGRIDLGMPQKKLAEAPGLPVRPQV